MQGKAQHAPGVFRLRITSGHPITGASFDDWLPLHAWTVAQVWERIRTSGVPHHPAYDWGMPRLSCCFCIFSPRSALLLAGKHNPELLARYVEVEKEIKHSFRKELPLAEIQSALAHGEEPGTVPNWTM